MVSALQTRRAFTLIELLVVMAIIAVLLTLAVPRYFGSMDKSKEAVLKEDLFQLRDAIGKFDENGKWCRIVPNTADYQKIMAPHDRGRFEN